MEEAETMVQTGRGKAALGQGLWMEKRGQAERMGRGDEVQTDGLGCRVMGREEKGEKGELTL